MGQYHFDPSTYGALVRAEVPDYDEFQDAVAAATSGVDARRILELGTGTGETTRRVLVVHGHAHVVGIDESDGMLAGARIVLPPHVDLRVARLEDPLPSGPYDIVVSALTVHHLPSAQKQELFERVRDVLRQGGRFVLGDVVVPEDPADAVTPIDPEHDRPDSVRLQLGFLRGAGFVPTLAWQRRDLAVIVGDRSGRQPPARRGRRAQPGRRATPL